MTEETTTLEKKIATKSKENDNKAEKIASKTKENDSKEEKIRLTKPLVVCITNLT